MRAALLAALFACASARPAATVEAGVPAVIVGASAESRAALLQAATDALRGRSLLLPDDAFAHDSTILVEPLHLDGREARTPDHLRLVKEGAQCVLLHDEARFVLVHTRCEAAGR